MALEPITQHGWAEQDGLLTFIWDTAKNMQAIRDRVKLILKGCKCITGCKTGRCSCKKSGRKCAEGCECISCSNMSNGELAEEDLAGEPEEMDELMELVFGE